MLPLGGTARSAKGAPIRTPGNPFALADWRRTIAELYAAVRSTALRDPAAAAADFRAGRDRLFSSHPESPIAPAERPRWRGSSWYPYDPAWRAIGTVDPTPPRTTFEIALAADGALRCTRVGVVHFALRGAPASLALYWFEGYGGGLWLPFADATNGGATCGGGRYLYDTIKGADPGAGEREIVLDFNFACNPSCAYDEQWSCPLSPSENRLPFAVTAGERTPGQRITRP